MTAAAPYAMGVPEENPFEPGTHIRVPAIGIESMLDSLTKS